jgi:ABC-type amino acid transport substrate-binding protein
MVRTVIAISLALVSGCSSPDAPGSRAGARPPAVTEIPPAAPQPVSPREKTNPAFSGDLDAIAARGYVRILVAPSRAYFQTIDGRHRGRAVDAGVALAALMSERAQHAIEPVFIETNEERLVPELLAGKGDVAANVLLTFARDEQVAFAPPIKSGIRELIVTDTTAPLVSLEDVAGRRITVRKNSDHHLSLIRLNEQLRKIDRERAVIIVDDKTRTDEELLDAVNAGRIRATVVDDYIFDLWQGEMLKMSSTNRDIAVSQDGVIAWVSRKDAPQLIDFLKDFFSTRQLKF